MRAAIYARYSTDLQSAASIEDQVRLCKERAAAEGDVVVDVFSDYAVSGGSMKNRPGMQALLAAVRAGRLDTVYAEALDRASRDQEDVAAIFKRLAHAEVRLVTLAEGEVTELHVGLKGTMNALFLKDLAAKTKRGQRGRVEAGKIAGGNSYGYRVARRMTADGDVVTGEREIEPAQAAIVCRIFAEYVAGATPRVIAAGLNRDGVPGPRGGPWNASTINGSAKRRNGVLNNELYIGRLVWNRQRFLKDPETGRRVSRPNPENEWIVSDAPDLRLVDDEIWEATRRLRSRHASYAADRRQRRKRVFSGLVTCSTCGGTMTTSGSRYTCVNRKERGTCDGKHGVGIEDLETRVLGGLKRLLLGRETLVETFAEEFAAEFKRMSRAREGDVSRLRKRLAEIDRSIERAVTLVTTTDVPPASILERIRALETEKAVIEAKIAKTPEHPTVILHPDFAALYRRKVEQLSALLR